MTEKGNIEKIFSEGFQDFQTDADASVWSGIENQLQIPVSLPAAGISIVTKTIIGLTTAAIITAGVFYFNKSKEKNSVSDKQQAQSENVTPVPTQPTEILSVTNSDDEKKTNTETANNFKQETVKSVNKTNTASETIDPKAETGVTGSSQINPEINKTASPSEVHKENSSTNPPVITSAAKGDERKTTSESEKESSTIQPAQNTQPTNSPSIQQPFAYKPFPFKYNIITPNGDGDNDVYYLESDGLDIIGIEAFILDAGSRRVGFINSMSSYWDGKDLKGNILPNGTYRIIVSATGADGTNYKGQKEIILNR